MVSGPLWAAFAVYFEIKVDALHRDYPLSPTKQWANKQSQEKTKLAQSKSDYLHFIVSSQLKWYGCKHTSADAGAHTYTCSDVLQYYIKANQLKAQKNKLQSLLFNLKSFSLESQQWTVATASCKLWCIKDNSLLYWSVHWSIATFGADPISYWKCVLRRTEWHT